MKSFVCVVLIGLVALTNGEPPRFRASRFRASNVFLRQELAPTDAAPADPNAAPYPPASSPEPAPYPPSGVTPENPLLLPTETTPAPAYGPPAASYGPPAQEYGPPSTAEDTTPNPEAETIAPPASARLRSAYLLLVDPATLKRIPIVPFQTQRQRQALPAKFRSRF